MLCILDDFSEEKKKKNVTWKQNLKIDQCMKKSNLQ